MPPDTISEKPSRRNFVLEASSVGYKTISRNVSLRKGKTLEENFELEEDAVALDGVVVSANRKA